MPFHSRDGEEFAPESEAELFERAVRLLARREHSRAELKVRLSRYNPDNQVVEGVLDRLAEKHWQSDSRFAEQFVSGRASGHGQRWLKQALAGRGVAGEAAQQALNEAAGDELARARTLWQRRFGQLPSSAEERVKQTRFLAGRGFSFDTIRRVLNSIDEDLPGDDE